MLNEHAGHSLCYTMYAVFAYTHIRYPPCRPALHRLITMRPGPLQTCTAYTAVCLPNVTALGPLTAPFLGLSF